MERPGLMMNELAHGRELATQLQKLLDPSSSSSSLEKHKLLIDQILSIYSKALNLLTNHHSENQPRPSKKRKILPRRVEKVKLLSGEELPSDGYSWRKYGQKIILGAKFRRGYFRCTHRHSQGCAALKQVQKSDEDPTITHVIYVGDHTCTSPCHIIRPSATINSPRVHLTLTQHPQEEAPQIQPQPQAAEAPCLHPKFTVQTEELNNGDQEKFYFRSISFSALFTDSPETSCSDHLPASPANINGVWTPDSVLREGFFAPDSVELTLEELGIIDPNFPFNNPEMFN